MDGNPVTFSDWYQPYPTHIQPFASDFFGLKINFVSPSLLQPTNDGSSECTALAFSTPLMSTNWIKIPCKFPFRRTGYICEIPMQSKQNVSQDLPKKGFTSVFSARNITVITPGLIHCPQGWTFFNYSCYKMFTSKGNINQPLTCSDARKICINNKGVIANVNNNIFDNILKLMRSWKHNALYGAIWVDGCEIIDRNYTVPEFLPTKFLLYKTKDHKSIPLHSLCEMKSFQASHACQRGQFVCDDGTCILDHHLCDGISDCITGEDEKNCRTTVLTFVCQDGSSVLMSKYCDFIDDCPDKSDEKNCTFPLCEPHFIKCNTGKCVKRLSECDENLRSKSSFNYQSKCMSFSCYNGQCLPDKYYQNGRPDCKGSAQEDEPFEGGWERGVWTNPSGEHKNYSSYCDSPDGTHTRCYHTHTYCYQRSDSCVYDHDKNGYITGCPDGSHLTNCEDFQCPDMFKCPKSYCIPHRKVCDGVQDCIGGFDEKGCDFVSCPGLFKCREGFCIDQSEVCDGVNHCPESHDDEVLCSNLTCPKDCECLGRSVRCVGSNLTNIPVIRNDVRVIDLTNNDIQVTRDTVLAFPYLGGFSLNSNRIYIIPFGAFKYLVNLLWLDLCHNSISVLETGMFEGLKSLQRLFLFGNPLKSIAFDSFWGLETLQLLNLTDLEIKNIDNGAFGKIPQLTKLYLQNNSIDIISKDTFKNVEKLDMLDLRGNPISYMHPDAFQAISIKVLHTDDHKFCCFAKNTDTCTPKQDAYSSCEDLMDNSFLQVAIWTLGFAAVLGNLFVIIWRTVKERKVCFSLLVINLGVSDLLMGIYLLIIAVADTVYRGKYALHVNEWLESGYCKMAVFLSTLSSEMSVFMLVVITSERLHAIIKPFSQNRLSYKQAVVVCFFGWSVFTAASILPVLQLSYFGENFIKIGVCLLFNGKTKGWEYVTFLVLVFNLSAFLFILTAYIVIYCSLEKTRIASNRQVSDSDVTLARRFALIVATDCMCWFPLIFVAFLSLGGVQIDPQVSKWMTVFILPLNSAVNPFLYTLSMIGQTKKKNKMKKMKYSTDNGNPEVKTRRKINSKD